jgi:ABC-type spermidine/putrescine transport system permease subunit I
MSVSLSKKYALLTIPGLLILFFIFFYPLTKIILLSLYTREIGGSYTEILTFHNYIHFFEQPVYYTILLRTLRIAIFVTVCSLFLGYPLAHLLSKMEKHMSFFLLMLILLSLWVNELIRSYAWMVMLQGTGLLNRMLLTLGIISNPIQFLENEFGVVVGMVHVLLPFMILPLFNNLTHIDENLALAAKGLGAAPSQVFFKITLPLSFPGIATGSLLVFLMALGLYITPSLLGGPKVMVMSTLISQQMLNILNWPFASASSCILLAFVLVTILLFRKFLRFEKLIGEV